MIAIIDIGSNTIRLSAYEIGGDGSIRQALKLKSVVGLAGYLDKKGALSGEGIREACAALNGFRAGIAGMGITETHAFATASLRNAANAAEAIEAIRRETGFAVTVISGEEEALCGYAGAINDTPMDSGLLADIGGGSTELVLHKNGEIRKAESIAIGTLSMYTKHVTKILPTKAQRQKIRAETDAALEMFGTAGNKAAKTVCGVGGVMRTLYKLNSALYGAAPDNRTVSAENAKDILELIDTDTHHVVSKIMLLTPERLHTFTPGLIILDAVIDKFGCETIIVSESGVREGYLLRNVLKIIPPSRNAQPR